jgi:hypothetical protein
MHFSIVLHCWKNICQGAKSTVSLMTQSPLCWCMSQTWKQIKKWTFLKNKFLFTLIGYVGTWGCCFIDYYPTSSFDISHDKVCDIWLSLGFLLSIGSSNNKKKRKEVERNGQDDMLTYKIEIECITYYRLVCLWGFILEDSLKVLFVYFDRVLFFFLRILILGLVVVEGNVYTFLVWWDVECNNVLDFWISLFVVSVSNVICKWSCVVTIEFFYTKPFVRHEWVAT